MRIAGRFPSAQIFFDTIPPSFSKRTLEGFQVTKHYRAPPMPWGISVDGLPAFLNAVPALRAKTVQTYADPFPSVVWIYKLLIMTGPVRRAFAPALAQAAVEER